MDFLIEDEPGRAYLTSMVACLFARSVYSDEQLAECLAAAGYNELAGSIEQSAEYIRKLRWQVRVSTGFNPEDITIPQRFYKVKTWKGAIDAAFLDRLKREYGRKIMEIAGADEP